MMTKNFEVFGSEGIFRNAQESDELSDIQKSLREKYDSLDRIVESYIKTNQNYSGLGDQVVGGEK